VIFCIIIIIIIITTTTTTATKYHLMPNAKFNMKIILVHSFPVLYPKTKEAGSSKILPPIYQVTSCAIPSDSTSLAQIPSTFHQHPVIKWHAENTLFSSQG